MDPPPILFGCRGGPASHFVFVPDGVGWMAALGSNSWLSISHGASGVGSGLVTMAAEPNVGPQRRDLLSVRGEHARLLSSVTLVQASAEPLATLNRSVLEVPFPATPRVMELGILGKFAAAQIQKIPEPFNLVALVVVEIAVVALGLIAILVRAAFTEVPEPQTWLGAPPPFDGLATRLPVTVVCISEETYLLAVYILEHAFGE